MKTIEALLAVLFVASPAAAACDSAREMEAEAFFNTDPGNVAIGENCNVATGLCRSYRLITSCPVVQYEIPMSQTSFSVTVNTSGHCEGQDCQTFQALEGYVAIAVAYQNNDYSVRMLHPVEMIRNPNWTRDYDYRRLYRSGREHALPEADESAAFFTHQSASASLQQFDENVFAYFHAKTSTDGLSSWDGRKVFANATMNDRCEGERPCSLKAFLFRFDETPNGIPDPPVRFSAAIAGAVGASVEVRSPLRQGVYNSSHFIEFIR
jgi:hypothetical protein